MDSVQKKWCSKQTLSYWTQPTTNTELIFMTFLLKCLLGCSNVSPDLEIDPPKWLTIHFPYNLWGKILKSSSGMYRNMQKCLVQSSLKYAKLLWTTFEKNRIWYIPLLLNAAQPWTDFYCSFVKMSIAMW